MRILMVEDDPTHGSLLSRLLTKQGHTVDIATGSTDVARLLASNRYDAAYIDWILDVETGMSAARLVHAARIGRVALVSACPDYSFREEDLNELKKFGVVWVTKPHDLAQLLAAWGLSDHCMVTY